MIIGSLVGLTVLLTLFFTFCTCCIIRCWRPERSPGPAWYPDAWAGRQSVNAWTLTKPFKSDAPDPVKDKARYHSVYGNVKGWDFGEAG